MHLYLYINDSEEADCNFIDADSDPTFALDCKAFLDGYISKYSNISINATANDGDNDSITRSSIIIQVSNSPPSVYSEMPLTDNATIDLTPDFIFNATDDNAEDTISCDLYVDSIIRGSDASVVNGSHTTITSSVLSIGSYGWYINCSDGTDIALSSNRTITIANPISITNVQILNATAYKNTTLVCSYDSENIDGGSYSWYNTSGVISGQTDPTLSPTYFIKGDIINCSFLGYNTTLNTNASNSSSGVTILNTPPSANQTLGGTYIVYYDTECLSLKWNISNIDGDTLTFADNSTKVNISNVGLITGCYAFSDIGNYSIAVNVTDGEAALTNAFNLSISYENVSSIINISYYGNISFGTDDYARTLTYNLTYLCPQSSNNNVLVYINDTYNRTIPFSCPGSTTQSYGYDYIHGSEGSYTITSYYNVSNFHTQIDSHSFVSDLYAPEMQEIMFNFTDPGSFVINDVNVSMRCYDNIFNNLTYNLTFNNNTLFNGMRENNYTQSNVSAPINGMNYANASCSDLFNATKGSYSHTVYIISFALVDEVTGLPFDVNNLTYTRVYFDDNSSYFDFKDEATTFFNFSSLKNDNLRFEFKYSDGTVITRYIDVSLVNFSSKICANVEGTTHYEQLIISTSQKPVAIKSVFADCYIVADYTRFAYQNGYLLKAYSINRQYYLYTFDSAKNQIFFTGIDGTVQSYINLDTLEFQRTAETITTNIDALTTELDRYSNGTIKYRTEKIYYYNPKGDNLNISLQISRKDTNATIFSSTTFSNPNEFIVIFDYSGEAGITNTTLFEINLTKTTDTGTSIIVRYFNIGGPVTPGIASRGLTSQIAFVLSLMLFAFGFTFAASRITFSWFGIFILLGALAILGFSPLAWYSKFLMAMELIALVWTAILLSMQNYPTISA